jgi:DNA-binding CsgD family transcriptional regulator
MTGPEITPRERQVLAWLARGLTIREIAWELYISPKTVGMHCANIKEKKNLANMHQLIVYAVRSAGAGR